MRIIKTASFVTILLTIVPQIAQTSNARIQPEGILSAQSNIKANTEAMNSNIIAALGKEATATKNAVSQIAVGNNDIKEATIAAHLSGSKRVTKATSNIATHTEGEDPNIIAAKGKGAQANNNDVKQIAVGNNDIKEATIAGSKRVIMRKNSLNLIYTAK